MWGPGLGGKFGSPIVPGYFWCSFPPLEGKRKVPLGFVDSVRGGGRINLLGNGLARNFELFSKLLPFTPLRRLTV